MTSGRIDDIDPFDPAVQENWFPTYRALRDDAPVYHMPGTQLFVVTRYADVLHIPRHQEISRPTRASIAA